MEANVRATSCLFVLACAVLSTGSAAARHHGHHYSHYSRDRADKPSADETKTDDRKSAKTVTSSKVDRDTLPHGGHHLTTRSVSDKELAPDTTIDTRISAYQGRLRIKGTKDTKDIKAHLFRKPKPAFATGTSLKPEHFHTRQAARELHRNAVGAPVGSDRTASTRSAVGSAPATAAVPATNPAPPNNNAVAGTAPTTNPNPAAPQIVNHPVGPANPAPVARDAAVVTGTGIARPGSSAGAIGGPPKIVAGIISGNSVHLKRP
jgi:hypothetical protein